MGVATAQNIVVKGTVKDAAGEPVIGATVIEKGNPVNGISTGIDGDFTLSVPKGKNLQISFIGFVTQEVAATAGAPIEVVLQEDAVSADEVVVLGYMNVVRKDLTGSVGSVAGEKLAMVPVASAAEALQGKIAGVQVTTVDGAPGADVDIRVRGAMDLTGTSKPLFIVDGFPADNINDIPPTDIQSIDVLKDASLTAIYGARGAHGVVMVTTKSAKAGRMKVDFNFSTRFNKLANKIEMMNTYEFARYQLDNALIKGGSSDRYQWREDFGNPWDLDLYQNLPTYDWQDEVMGGTPVSYNYNVTINGGSEKLRFNASLTHSDEEGILLGSGVERTNFNMKVNAELAKNLTLLVNPRFTIRKDEGAGADAFGRRGIIDILRYRPTNAMREFGYVDPEYADPLIEAQWAISNPVNDVDQNYKEKMSYQFVNQASLEWKPIEGLRLRTEFSHTFGFGEENRFYGYLTNEVANSTYLNQPYAYIKDSRSTRYTWTTTAAYNFTAKENHNFSFLAGFEMQGKDGRTNQSTARFFPQLISPEQALANMGLGSAYQVTSSMDVPDRTASYFAQANYNYKHKYYLSATFRADGSSKFAKGKQWGYFPSISGAWVISEENFMQSQSVINNLKLRASIGISGNNNINDDMWRFLYTVKSTGGPGFGEATVNGESWYANTADGKTYPNPNIKWEKTLTRNAALDMGFFNDRLTITPEVYWNTTSDLLYWSDVPTVSGYQRQIRNIGQVTNKGFELSITGDILRGKDYVLTATASFGMNKRKIDKLNDTDDVIWDQDDSWKSSYNDYCLKVGEETGLIYGFVYDGLYTMDEFDFDPNQNFLAIPKEGTVINTVFGDSNTGVPTLPGKIKFKDLNNDGQIDEKDRTVIGNTNPKFQGGFGLSGRWRNFDFTMNFNYMLDFDINNAMAYTLSSAEGNANNFYNVLSKFHGNRWTYFNPEDGDNLYQCYWVDDTVERYAAANANATLWNPADVTNKVTHSYFIEDGSFLRCQDITIGYTLPSKITRKWSISRLRFYASATNPFIITGYSGYDPEVDVQTGLTCGMDYNRYPRSRTFVFGVNLTF